MSTANELLSALRKIEGVAPLSDRRGGAFKLQAPRAPWKAQQFEDRQKEIFRLFSRLLPECGILLDEHDTDILATVGRSRSPDTPAGEGTWVILPSSEVETLLPALYRGAWGLFFSNPGCISQGGPPQLTFDPVGALELTRQLGAVAGIISWYDDNEWLISIVGPDL